MAQQDSAGASPAALVLKPLLRGRLHQLMVFLAIPGGIWLIVRAQGASARIAVSIYAVSLVALYATSATYHRGNWSPRGYRIMRSLDHSMIYLLIAGTGTAFGVLVLDGWLRVVFLISLWVGAVTGMLFKLVKIEGFARLGGFLYIALGWLGVATVPQAISRAETGPLLLIALGGVMYTIGAVIFFLRRPDPKPTVFGYHEVWHTFVVAASACQYAAISMLLPQAASV